VDRWGVERTLPVDGGHYYVSRPPLASLERASDLRTFAWPEPELDWTELGERARCLHGSTDKALVLNLEVGFLHQTQFVWGFERWLMNLAGDPRLAAAVMDRVLDIWLVEAAAMIDAVRGYGDVVLYADDIAFQDRPMVSPQMYRTLIKPRQKHVFDLLQQSGMKVLYHSCGNVWPLVPDLIEMGVEALNPIQVSAAEMGDTSAFRKKWGRELAFWGGVDTQHVLPLGTPQEVRQEVWRRLDDMARDGGYVLASVHNLQPEIPPENVCAMFDAAEVWLTSKGERL
jgi:uroporphyrinogen decarboxylase